MGVFASALSVAIGQDGKGAAISRKRSRGLASWLLDRLQRRKQEQPRLALVERITLAPRQSLALVEADGHRVLVATSQDSAPTFYPLKNQRSGRSGGRIRRSSGEGKGA